MTQIDAMGSPIIVACGDDRQRAKIEKDAPMDPVPLLTSGPTDLIPIIQVEYPSGMWWDLPIEKSREILAAAQQSTLVPWVWQWQKTKQGTYKPEGVSTGQSRYIFNFETHQQTNRDTNYVRNFRVVFEEAKAKNQSSAKKQES